MRKLGFVLVASVLTACSGGHGAPDVWALKKDMSSLTFVTNKNAKVDETHSFEILMGRVTADGQVSIRVPLISVNTQIPTRDERMGSMLFETKQYPELIVTSQLDMERLNEIRPTMEVRNYMIDIVANLHGRTIKRTISVVIRRPSWNKVRVISMNPVIVNAADFNLEGGVDALRDIAGLKEISYTVPISFDLTFIGQ